MNKKRPLRPRISSAYRLIGRKPDLKELNKFTPSGELMQECVDHHIYLAEDEM